MTIVQKQNIRSLIRIKKYDVIFDMEYYFKDGDNLKLYDPVYERDYVCGTSACLAGHLPLVTGIPKMDHEDWESYIYRTTGLACKDVRYEYLFSSWSKNSKNAAIRRVMNFINNNYEAPEGWEFGKVGEERT